MNRIFKSFIIAVSLCGATSLFAQTTRQEVLSDLNRTGGVYYAYPQKEFKVTVPPKGYEPFYISHVGRHGSRYLIGDNDYLWIAKLLREAQEKNALTPLGLDLLERIDSLMIEAGGRGGALSPLGVRQHRGIAERMYQNYKQVFKQKNCHIEARSTMVVRCVLSMAAFTERLKELNPTLDINRESSQRHLDYINYYTEESNNYRTDGKLGKERFRKFKESHTRPDRIVNSIFSDADFVEASVNPSDFMWGLYWLASDAQNTESKIDFYCFFTPDELFDLWQVFNYDFYVNCSNYKDNGGIRIANSKPLLNNIIECADQAIATGNVATDLRFAHDGNIVPLSALMRLDGCYTSISDPNEFYKVFSDWKISPMASNIQLVFFRSSKDPNDILVKIMLNEEEKTLPIKSDIAPFYKWSDVKAYYTKILNATPQQLTDPNL